MRRLFAALTLLTLLALTAAPIGAAPPTPPNPAGQDHQILGAVHPRTEAGSGGSGGNLVNHGGPVMQAGNTAYAIYWVPPGYAVSANYQTLIDGFFQNVALDNGQQSNVYFSDTQYSNIRYFSAFGGSTLDTTPFPANQCTDSYTSVCLSDGQLTSEIQAVMQTNKWTPGPDKLYFLFTPKGVGSCSGSSCAFSQYCAYHSRFTPTNGLAGTVLYANQPYTATVPAACDSGQHPNNDDADGTINVVSHEHNEAITDPQGSAWFDRRGAENGDKCAWTFGTPLGGTSGQYYNQLINGGKYYLQREWSNASSGCVLTGK
jgi:hypothetical protein